MKTSLIGRCDAAKKAATSCGRSSRVPAEDLAVAEMAKQATATVDRLPAEAEWRAAVEAARVAMLAVPVPVPVLWAVAAEPEALQASRLAVAEAAAEDR